MGGAGSYIRRSESLENAPMGPTAGANSSIPGCKGGLSRGLLLEVSTLRGLVYINYLCFSRATHLMFFACKKCGFLLHVLFQLSQALQFMNNAGSRGHGEVLLYLCDRVLKSCSTMAMSMRRAYTSNCGEGRTCGLQMFIYPLSLLYKNVLCLKRMLVGLSMTF